MAASKKYLILISFVIVTIRGFCQDGNLIDKPDVPKYLAEITLLDSATNLFEAGDFYISGQPNDSILIALKKQDLKLIINIRTVEEIETLKENGFDGESLADSLNIAYINVPVGGNVGYTTGAVKDIDEAIQQHPGKTMIHCRRAGRATYVWMAWLINYQNMPVDDAISLGKQMKFSLTLEDLLGYELSFDKK